MLRGIGFDHQPQGVLARAVEGDWTQGSHALTAAAVRPVVLRTRPREHGSTTAVPYERLEEIETCLHPADICGGGPVQAVRGVSRQV